MTPELAVGLPHACPSITMLICVRELGSAPGIRYVGEAPTRGRGMGQAGAEWGWSAGGSQEDGGLPSKTEHTNNTTNYVNRPQRVKTKSGKTKTNFKWLGQ